MDLWPDFSNEKVENNDALEIIREQTKILEKKTDNKVKATFSKVSYKNNLIADFSRMSAELSAQTNEEISDDELANRGDANNFFNTANYKFEIYNDIYKFRVFLLEYRKLYPIEFKLDEGINNEVRRRTQIRSNTELIDFLKSVFSSPKLKNIIFEMMK